MKPKHLILPGLLVLGIVGFGIWYDLQGSSQPQQSEVLASSTSSASIDKFAQCLSDKQITMYGAYWCTHCQNEKKAFGDSFRFVKYVECTKDPKLCLEQGVESYPTWIFPDGKKLEGEQGLQKLSQESSCPVE